MIRALNQRRRPVAAQRGDLILNSRWRVTMVKDPQASYPTVAAIDDHGDVGLFRWNGYRWDPIP